MAALTLNEQFNSLCFVGLERVEYHAEGSDQAIFADSWMDVSDEQGRRTMGLLFFAPRELDGAPVNPYAYLTMDSGGGMDEESIIVAQHTLAGIPLVDMCRMPPAAPNTLNILVVADIIFHWDMKDNYIMPTTQLSWLRDVKRIIKDYPRTTSVTIYTDWQNDQIAELKAQLEPVKNLPFYEQTWLNRPTFQQKYGTHVLLGAVLLAGASYLGLHFQNSTIEDLNTQIRTIEANTPRGGNSAALEQLISEQEGQMAYRNLIPLVVKDTAVAITNSDMKAQSFEVKNVNPKEAPQNLLVTIEAQPGAYKGWLQEEPIAKKLMANSLSIVGIRKPPIQNRFRLEGLVDLERLANQVDTYQEQRRLNGEKQDNILPELDEPTTPETAEEAAS